MVVNITKETNAKSSSPVLIYTLVQCGEVGSTPLGVELSSFRSLLGCGQARILRASRLTAWESLFPIRPWSLVETAVEGEEGSAPLPRTMTRIVGQVQRSDQQKLCNVPGPTGPVAVTV